MSRSENDVWSDVNNPNNSASLDDWADAHNPNNPGYIDDSDDYDDPVGRSEWPASLIQQAPPSPSFVGYEGEPEQDGNGEWFVRLKRDQEVIESARYASKDECMNDVERTYPGCRLIESRTTVDLRAKPSTSPYADAVLGALLGKGDDVD
ncbi:MAG: hypothetical protein P1U64_11865 [Alcanivoracaceae bacterium]|nr:hypothetical protein [Alcanivoracaceae bacterium]